MSSRNEGRGRRARKEERKETNPSVLDSLLPGSSSLTDTDDNVDSLVSSVESLSVTLRSVPNHGEGIVLEVPSRAKSRERRKKDQVSLELSEANAGRGSIDWRAGRRYINSLLELGQRPVSSLVDILLGSSEVEGLDTSLFDSRDSAQKKGGRTKKVDSMARWKEKSV